MPADKRTAKKMRKAIARALDAVSDLAVLQEEVDRGLDKLVGKRGFTDHFGPAAS